jgi:hypothetical protein
MKFAPEVTAKLHSGLREEKEIFGANNRDTVSVHQNGCKTGVLPRSINGASGN